MNEMHVTWTQIHTDQSQEGFSVQATYQYVGRSQNEEF